MCFGLRGFLLRSAGVALLENCGIGHGGVCLLLAVSCVKCDT